MDQIKNALSGHSGSSQQSSNQESGQKQDYGDKGKHLSLSSGPYDERELTTDSLRTAAFKAVNDKAGWGLSESTQEKVTDFGRQAYEKSTG